MHELRKHRRISIQTEIWIGQDGIFTRTPETLRDLSEGGAFIETAQRFAIGSILSMRFTVPGHARLISSTVIVRNLRGDTGIGVQFLDLSTDHHDHLLAYIATADKASSYARQF